MLVNAIADKGLKAKTVYASWEKLKLAHALKRTFYTTLKSNCMVSLSKEDYVHLDAVEWTPERLQVGVVVKLKKVPFKVKLFKLVAPAGGIDWLITNELETTCQRRSLNTRTTCAGRSKNFSANSNS